MTTHSNDLNLLWVITDNTKGENEVTIRTQKNFRLLFYLALLETIWEAIKINSNYPKISPVERMTKVGGKFLDRCFDI